MEGCGMKLVKYLVFAFNFLFWLSGLALILVGAIIKNRYGEVLSYTDHKFASAEVLLIVIGVIICVIGFLGCCGAIKENYCMITTFSVLLSIIFIMEIAAGILGYQYRKDVRVVVNKALERAVDNYAKEVGARHVLDWAQSTLTCCGDQGPGDYDSGTGNKTLSPCGLAGQGVKTCHVGGTCAGTLHADGCNATFSDFVDENLALIGAVAVGVAFLELLGVIFACCLMSAIRKEYEVM